MHVSGFFLKTNSSTLSIHYSAYLHNEITVLKHFTKKKENEINEKSKSASPFQAIQQRL